MSTKVLQTWRRSPILWPGYLSPKMSNNKRVALFFIEETTASLDEQAWRARPFKKTPASGDDRVSVAHKNARGPPWFRALETSKLDGRAHSPLSPMRGPPAISFTFRGGSAPSTVVRENPAANSNVVVYKQLRRSTNCQSAPLMGSGPVKLVRIRSWLCGRSLISLSFPFRCPWAVISLLGVSQCRWCAGQGKKCSFENP